MNWFHKKDGGLMVIFGVATPNDVLCRCAICGQTAHFRGGFLTWPLGKKFLIWPLGKKFVHFFDLPEGLQAAALEEML